MCKREIDKISADGSDFLQGQELKLCTLNSWNWRNLKKVSNNEEMFQFKWFFLKKCNRTTNFFQLFDISRRNGIRLMVSNTERWSCKDTIGNGPRRCRDLSRLGMKEFYHSGLAPSPPAVIPSRKLIPTLRVAGVEPWLLKEHWLFQQLRCHQEKGNLSRRMITFMKHTKKSAGNLATSRECPHRAVGKDENE